MIEQWERIHWITLFYGRYVNWHIDLFQSVNLWMNWEFTPNSWLVQHFKVDPLNQSKGEKFVPNDKYFKKDLLPTYAFMFCINMVPINILLASGNIEHYICTLYEYIVPLVNASSRRIKVIILHIDRVDSVSDLRYSCPLAGFPRRARYATECHVSQLFVWSSDSCLIYVELARLGARLSNV